MGSPRTSMFRRTITPLTVILRPALSSNCHPEERQRRGIWVGAISMRLCPPTQRRRRRCAAPQHDEGSNAQLVRATHERVCVGAPAVQRRATSDGRAVVVRRAAPYWSPFPGMVGCGSPHHRERGFIPSPHPLTPLSPHSLTPRRRRRRSHRHPLNSSSFSRTFAAWPFAFTLGQWWATFPFGSIRTTPAGYSP